MTTSPTTPETAKPKAKRVTMSPMRKLTSQLDVDVRKLEADKKKLAALQKSIAEGEATIEKLLLERATITK